MTSVQGSLFSRDREPSEFNPQFETCGVKMLLTEICHDMGNRAEWGANNCARDYCRAYYDTMVMFAPWHPALKQFIKDEGLTSADIPELERQRFQRLAKHLEATL